MSTEQETRPYPCGAFVADTGERCLLDSDHEGHHVFESDAPAGAQGETANAELCQRLGIQVGLSSLSWEFREGLRVDSTGGTDESRWEWLLRETSYLIDDMARKQKAQTEGIARLRAENERLTKERDEAVAENQWTVEEHQKAWAALRQSEGTAANTFASFEERVWWKEAIRAREESESQVQALQEEIARLRVERDRLREALAELAGDANRICDRCLGGAYEEDCRRSVAKARAALAPQTKGPQP